MTLRSNDGPVRLLAPYLAAVIPLVAGALLPGSLGWSWGWDHVHRLGPVAAIAFVGLALAVLIPAVRRLLMNAADRIGSALAASPARTALAVAISALAVFAALPIATRIYGDSRYILDDHAATGMATHWRRLVSLGVQSRGSAVFLLHDLLERATGLTYEKCFEVVSVLCGAVFVFAHARFALRARGMAGWARWVILWLGLTDGANQLFFGHVEIYTVPRLFACLFLLQVVEDLLAVGKRSAIPAIVFLLLALFFHAQQIVLLPAFGMWMIERAGRSRPALHAWMRGRVLLAGLAVAAVGVAITYAVLGATCYDYIYSGGRPLPRQIVLPLSTACVGAPYLRYTLFSASHLQDFFGSLFTVSSGAVLFTLLAAGRSVWSDRRFGIFAASIAAGAFHNFFINTAIGFPFDWDLLCVLAPPLLYAAVYAVARLGAVAEESDGAGAAPATAVAAAIASATFVLGLATLALFAVNADREKVSQRVEDMGVWLHRSYYGGSHYRLSANASAIADPAKQIAARTRVMERLKEQTYLDDREVAFLWEKLAISQITQGDYEGALVSYREALRSQPSKVERKKPVGYLESEVGDLEEGIRLLSEYLRDNQADAEGWMFLGDACARAGLADIAARSWTRFLDLTPDAPEAPRVRTDLESLHR